ncbi:CAP domain-containing protein [Corynebacterium sp. SFY-K9]|uniref:CAP domain-containing protein n=1 Tax=Corynebacterium sp. SFY-K9 TaxID=3092263 RepID=UPI00298F3BF5|nr:CAP domain-containing protein [Corynebacterium sp. SFY-K9]
MLGAGLFLSSTQTQVHADEVTSDSVAVQPASGFDFLGSILNSGNPEPVVVQGSAPSADASTIPMDQGPDYIIDQANKDREANGLPAFEKDATLTQKAQEWSQHMADNQDFNHSDMPYAENIYTSNSKEAIAEAEQSWMNSPGHRANILDSGKTKIGVGVAYSEQNHSFYMTQLFE